MLRSATRTGPPRRRLAVTGVAVAFLAIAFLFRNPILVFIGQIIERIDPGGGSPSLVGPRPLDVLQVVVSNEPDAALRRQWQEAIRRGRAPVRADRTIERSAPHNDDTANLKEWLLTRLVESTEEDRQCAGELARKLTNSKDPRDRQPAFIVLTKYFPRDQAATDLFTRLLQSESDALWMSRPLRWLSLAHPQVYSGLLQDGRQCQVLALHALRSRLFEGSPQVHPAGDNQVLVAREKESAADPELMELARRTAAALLESEASPDQDAAIRFLTYCPDGGHDLVRAAAAAEDALLRERLVRALADITMRVYHKWDSFQFTLEEGDLVVDLLLDPDYNAEQLALHATCKCLRPSRIFTRGTRTTPRPGIC